jgi:type IV pilus assembly protein PilV
MMNTKSRQTGLVMLEGLIAILIFSMAILGVVGMQATAIGKGSESQYRADAAFLANQLLAQMWVHAGSGVYISQSGIGIVSVSQAAAVGIPAAGLAAAPNLFHYHCPNCTVALATAAGNAAGDPEFVTWLQSIQGTANQPGFLPGVTDTMNMPDVEVGCSAEDNKAASMVAGGCSITTFPQSATQVTITLHWQKSTRAGAAVHQYQTLSNIEPK